jgi:hypothetical protein
MHHAALVNLGSEPPLAAFAHRKNWITAPSVRFHHVAQLDLWAQRMAALCPKPTLTVEGSAVVQRLGSRRS